jgi:hypothetical protein
MKKDEMGETRSTNEEMRNVKTILVRKALGKLLLGDLGVNEKIILK